ncbi:MAG: phospholipase phosphocholine-specific [Amycolatopsis sp.]|uniref:phosphocholine-specific phospholipase C n=1 Tax=Amycolatopsis sp. TaxID=37632 RepID=UPI00260CE64E|nr:phospholipase C, phosphocholine-specific [Amycolatopsis sp.]MCU1681470.1 phospholipase phosphocholine-specific [Amycolatopsis sp.]
MAESRFPLTRRQFLGGAAAAGALSMLPPGMAESLAQPAVRGSLSDVKHVVVLMQENRSFDHYYGTMSGVRGFGDRTALTMPNGLDVLHQPSSNGKYVLPFHVDTAKVDGQDMGDLGHNWPDQHNAVGAGANRGWISAKGPNTMGYFTDADIPFHRALAGAFTTCDHYYCSVQGATTPNRIYLFTGTIDADGKYGTPANYNPADSYAPIHKWTTYPERLQAAGIPWKVYANKEVGYDEGKPFVGDYGDNPLWLFQAYHDNYDSDLSKRASVFKTWAPDSGQGKDVNHVLTEFVADCKSGSLPKVSWVVAPESYTEHPAKRPVDGAAYTQTVLNALWANQDLWSSTVLLINYDENDGFFDHVPPPLPPAGAADEFISGLPVGLGVRVPMTVVSPWSKGGWVNSQVFDHTSVIRFLEQWTGVQEPNISAWRRSTCGDLTSCFDFGQNDVTTPSLPDTAALRKRADDTQSKLPQPAPPADGSQTVPVQDSGTRPARPLPYQPSVTTSLSADKTILTTTFINQGTAAVQLAAYRADGQTDGPWQYDVAAGGSVSDTWRIKLYGGGKYNVAVHGPNRFLWQFAGNTAAAGAGVEVVGSYTADGRLLLTMTNSGTTAAALTVTANHYRSGSWTYSVPANGSITGESWDLGSFNGWYDLSATVAGDSAYLRRFTGHHETGLPTVTG